MWNQGISGQVAFFRAWTCWLRSLYMHIIMYFKIDLHVTLSRFRALLLFPDPRFIAQSNKTKLKIFDLMNSGIWRRERRRVTKCLLKVQSKTKQNRSFFRVVVSLHPPGGNYFALSRNTTAIKDKSMFPWPRELLAVNYFELFESLNFETVQDVKIGSKSKDWWNLINISDKCSIQVHGWSEKVRTLPWVR